MAQTNNVTPDMQLAARVAKAVEKRDRANKEAIEFSTEVKLAKSAAEESRAEALREHGVSTLDELSNNMKTFYAEDLSKVEQFEREVAEYAAVIEQAKAILAEAKAL